MKALREFFQHSIVNEAGMIKKILGHSTQVLLLSLSLFFIVSSGMVFRSYWVVDPMQRLLEKDGSLLVSVFSNPKTIDGLRRMLGYDKVTKDASFYFIDKLLEKDGALLVSMAGNLLKQSSVKELMAPKPSTKREGKALSEDSAWLGLGRHALDRLFQKDGKLTISLAKNLLPMLLEPSKQAGKKVGNQKKSQSTEPFRVAEKLGRYLIDSLLRHDAKLVTSIAKSIISFPQKRSGGEKQPTSSPVQKNAENLMAERLGRYAIDKLLAQRARPLRSILQEIAGAEPMRVMREGRQILEGVRLELKKIPLSQWVQNAAYELGRGSLDAFLKKQEKDAQKLSQNKYQLEQQLSELTSSFRLQNICFSPSKPDWLQWKNTSVEASLRFLPSKTTGCLKQSCKKLVHNAKMWLSQAMRKRKIQNTELKVQLLKHCL